MDFSKNFIQIVLLLIYFVFGSSVHAFNWNKCWKKVALRGEGLGFFASTTSYFSSTGACSMIGMRSHDSKVFIAQNLEPLKADSARGQGEYLRSFAYLMGCNRPGTEGLSHALQSNFTDIFGRDVEATPKEAYERIERFINGDTTLKNHCFLSVI